MTRKTEEFVEVSEEGKDVDLGFFGSVGASKDDDRDERIRTQMIKHLVRTEGPWA